MDSRMSRLSGPRAGVETAEAVGQTCAAYERAASAYAEATKHFADYPGLRAAILSFADALPAHLPILDVGCGGGRDARLLAGRRKRVVAGDISPAMLTYARRLTDEGLYPDI